MTVYGFKDKNNAQALNRFASEVLGKTNSGLPRLGEDCLIVKVPEGETLEALSGGNAGELVCEIQMLGTSLALGDTGNTCKVYNATDAPFESGTVFTAVRVKSLWHAVGGGGESTAPKRVKFKLTGTLLNAGSLLSGFTTATVIDPMNSGLAIGFEITVWDYKKQFVTAPYGAIGIAILQAPFTSQPSKQWHIEECEQLINKISGELTASIGPWITGSANVAELTSMQNIAAWPYVHWDTAAGESSGATVDNWTNDRRFTAGHGATSSDLCGVTAERVIPNAYLPDPDNETAPYTLAPLTSEWELTSVEFPTARWAATVWQGGSSGGASTFNLAIDGEGTYAEGNDPTKHSSFSGANIGAGPPSNIADQYISEFDCNIPEDTAGWSFLDDTEGRYVTVMTASAMFGVPTKIDLVAKEAGGGVQSELIKNKEGSDSCGEIEHEQMINALVWGNTSGSGTGCLLENITPLPSVDLFANMEYQDVVIGFSIDANGDMVLQKKSIKACIEDASDTVVALQSTDIVTDVACLDGVVNKTYETIKYLGKTINGPNTLALECTDPDNYDWEYIFNNHVYNESWWNVNYYDITFPAGCEPCPEPTGCCTATAYPDGQGGITQAACEAETGYESWTEGDCDSCCDTLTVSQSDFGDPSNYTDGSGSIGFTFVSITDNGGCSWTINGTWTSNFNGTSPAGTYDLTYDEATSTWSISGSIPSPYGGTVSGSAVLDACTVQSNTILDITVTGSHLNFGGGTSSYSGTVRIGFTQTG